MTEKVHFDVKQMRELLTRENTYLMDLWKKLIVQQHRGSIDLDDEVYAGDSQGEMFHGGKSRAKSVEELHNRLHELKGKKLQYKERLLKKGLKNRLIKKKKKEERKMNKTLVNMSQQGSKFEAAMKTKPSKPVFNSEGKLVFSKFDFSVSERGEKSMERDPQKILKKLEKHKEKMEQLEKEGEAEKVAEMKAKEEWKTALKRAEGVKIKDDPALLKKSIKKKAERKRHSEKKWKKREEMEQQKQEKKQEKRESNIEEHSRKRKTRKVKRLVKHGRLIKGVNV